MMSLPFIYSSPVEEIQDPYLAAKKIQLFVKRDDKIHPFISGNKWRKLKYHLSWAAENNIKTLVTFGGAWSNHLLATAAAGANFGFKTVGFVRGEEVKNPVLSMCSLFGMQLRFVDRVSYKNKEEIFGINFTQNEALFIDEGGKSTLGIQGCSEILNELQYQYDHIFCAAGTGTTIVGIQEGINLLKLKTQAHCIPVLKGGEFLLKEFEDWGIENNKIQLHSDYHFGGYAKTKPVLNQFIKKFTSTTGIMIEPTYTGKLFYGVYDLIAKDYFEKNSKILVIHTGGLTGLLGHLPNMEI